MKRILLLSLALAFMAAGVALLLFASLSDRESTPAPEFAQASPTPAPTAEPTAEATPEPLPVNTSPVVRLQVPRIGIDARVVILGVDPDGTMQSPANPRDVAAYTFAAHPGEVGNVVMAGHLDYINYGAAVLWRLRELQAGDDVFVELEDGSRFVYRVLSLTSYDADAPVAEIVGPTPTQAITLITCAGSFDRTVREYNKRLVVRGERVAGSS